MATVLPRITDLDGIALVRKLRSITVPAGTAPTVGLTILDEGTGNPVDLTPYASPPAPAAPASPLVQFRAAEAAGGGRGGILLAGSVADAAAGAVQATLDPRLLGVPGIYEAAFCVYDPTGTPAAINSFFLFLEPNLFAGHRQGFPGPPRLDEVRLHIRDSDAAESRLLTASLFDDAEILQALLKAVQAWNAALPPICPFDTSTFPREFRYPLLEGAAAQLLYTAAEWYRKNFLPVQGAGGVAVADMDRADTLDKAADRRWQQYLAWVRQQKVALNIGRGFGRLGSPYRIIAYAGVMNA